MDHDVTDRVSCCEGRNRDVGRQIIEYIGRCWFFMDAFSGSWLARTAHKLQRRWANRVRGPTRQSRACFGTAVPRRVAQDRSHVLYGKNIKGIGSCRAQVT